MHSLFVLCYCYMQIKAVKKMLAETMSLTGLLAKLTEEEMEDKGTSKESVEKMIEVRVCMYMYVYNTVYK